MMKVLFSTFILLLLFSLRLFPQAAADENVLLEWNEFYDLTWDDFRGNPGEGAIGDAGTAVKITAKPYYVKKQVQYDVTAYFDRGKSWSRGKSDALLKHEQLHFDIAELYARKIRKKIIELSLRGEDDLSVFNSAIRRILEESNEADQRYDLETLHGALQKKQALWEKQVKEQLQGLKDYKKQKRVIAVKKALINNPLVFGR